MEQVDWFLLFALICFGVTWWEYRKYQKKIIKSYKVAYIMESEYGLYSKAYEDFYSFGHLDDYHQNLKKEVTERLFEEGISRSFLNLGGYRGLECRSVKDWEANFSYLRYDKVFKKGNK